MAHQGLPRHHGTHQHLHLHVLSGNPPSHIGAGHQCPTQRHWGNWQRCKIRTHSIHSGLAMAMYLGECPVYTIMLIGRWSSDAFLWYICKQVMEFSHNVSQKMLNYQNYWYVPNFEHQIPENNTRQRNDPNNAKTRQNLGGDASRQVRLPAFSQFN